MKRVMLMAALGATVLAGPALAQEAKRGGEIRVGIDSDITTIEPGVRRSGTSDTVLHHMVESLVAYDGDLKVAPMLAENISLSDNKLRYEMTIREGATFHNGAPVTSEEVRWSWDRMMDQDGEWQCASWYTPDGRAKLASVEVVDPKTIAFNLSEPNALFLHYMASIQCITAILHPDSVDENGRFSAPVGSGPYMLDEWRKGEFVLLKRYEDYEPRTEPRSGMAGAKVPYADTIRFMVIPDSASQLAGITSGQVDQITVDVQDIATLKDVSGVRLEPVQGLSWNMLLLQTDDPVLSDIRIRQAIAHAIDLETLVKVRTDGLGVPNPSAVPNASPFYSDVHKTGYEFDLEKARALLEEAGYDGERITIQANRQLSYMYDTAVVAQAMLRQAGLNVDLEVMDWATQLDKYSAADFQIQSFRFSARTDPTLNFGTFLGPKAEDPEYQWDDPKYTELAIASGAMFDEEQRQATFETLHTAMLDAVPLVSLYNSILFEASSERIHGFEPLSLGKSRLWGVWVEE